MNINVFILICIIGNVFSVYVREEITTKPPYTKRIWRKKALNPENLNFISNQDENTQITVHNNYSKVAIHGISAEQNNPIHTTIITETKQTKTYTFSPESEVRNNNNQWEQDVEQIWNKPQKYQTENVEQFEDQISDKLNWNTNINRQPKGHYIVTEISDKTQKLESGEIKINDKLMRIENINNQKKYTNMAFENCPKNYTGPITYLWSCSQFLNCWKGRGIVQNCASGTYFNPETLECDYPNKVNCISGPNDQKVKFEKYTNNNNNYEISKICPPNFTGLIKHPSDCTKFINCNYGVTVIQDCGPGTAFNSLIQSCDHADKVGCKINTENIQNFEKYTQQNNIYNSRAHSVQYTNKYQQNYQAQNQNQDVKCPKDHNGLLPHPYICEKFLNCANGATFIQDCGPGTVFNPKLKTCDWPYNVKCTTTVDDKREINVGQSNKQNGGGIGQYYGQQSGINIAQTHSQTGQNTGQYYGHHTGQNNGQQSNQNIGHTHIQSGQNSGQYYGQQSGQNVGQIHGQSGQSSGQYYGQQSGQNVGQTHGQSGQSSGQYYGQQSGQNVGQTQSQTSHNTGQYYGQNTGQNYGQTTQRNITWSRQNIGQNHSQTGQNSGQYYGQQSGQNVGQTHSHNTGQYYGQNSGQNYGQTNQRNITWYSQNTGQNVGQTNSQSGYGTGQYHGQQSNQNVGQTHSQTGQYYGQNSGQNYGQNNQRNITWYRQNTGQNIGQTHSQSGYGTGQYHGQQSNQNIAQTHTQTSQGSGQYYGQNTGQNYHQNIGQNVGQIHSQSGYGTGQYHGQHSNQNIAQTHSQTNQNSGLYYGQNTGQQSAQTNQRNITWFGQNPGQNIGQSHSQTGHGTNQYYGQTSGQNYGHHTTQQSGQNNAHTYGQRPEHTNQNTGNTYSPTGQNKSNCQYFDCSFNECIPTIWVCDGEKDCRNGKDEENCPKPSNTEQTDQNIGQITTQSSVRNITNYNPNYQQTTVPNYSYNTVQNTTNYDQNLGQTKKSQCRETAFDCSFNECIPQTWLCDGEEDCKNGIDEKNCPTGQIPGDDKDLHPKSECSESAFDCANNECIPKSWLCDGEEDCINGSDETNCQKPTTNTTKPKPEIIEPVEPITLTKTINVKGSNHGIKTGQKIEKITSTQTKKQIGKHWPPPFPSTDTNADYYFEDVKEEKKRNDLYEKHFVKLENTRLYSFEVVKYLDTSLDNCMKYCLNMDKFTCRSLNYMKHHNICLLCNTNAELAGSLGKTNQYDYYGIKKYAKCDNKYRCSNGKCISYSKLCDGNDDCGNRDDEKKCNANVLGYELRLAGGEKSNEGRLEVKVFDEWGYVCDDHFSLLSAEVACKELGFDLGAMQVRGASYYAQDIAPNSTWYLMDDVQCDGSETTIRDCPFSGWGQHNCAENEIVGVVCKTREEKCPEEHWKCDTSQECLPLELLCDNIVDCQDKSDEGIQHCEAPIELRLVNGTTQYEGRVEVRYHGVWGTVCDDDVSSRSAAVICRALGLEGDTVVKGGRFGSGTGPIWLDQLACAGYEQDVTQCAHATWGVHNCEHKEDVGVVCSSPGSQQHEKKSKDSHSLNITPIKPTIEDTLFDGKCGYTADDIFTEDNNGNSMIQARVVRGSIAKRGAYPWQATIRVKQKHMSSHWCGAVIISSKFVLTAAHCLLGFPKGAYVVRAGDYSLDIDEHTELESYIEDFYSHEDFRRGGHMNNDIALVKLKGSGFKLNKHVQPLCLPDKNVEDKYKGKNCTISGFGSTESGQSSSSRQLRGGWVTIQPDEVCKRPQVYGDAITPGMFCAGSLEEGVDSCDGDSGGPLACLDNGLFTLYGLTSWGHRCGHINKPGVYVKVAHYRDWIDNIIAEYS